MQYSIDILKGQIPMFLKTGRGNLLAAIDTVSAIDIPSDFEYSSMLRNIAINIEQIMTAVDKIQEWIADKVDRIEQADRMAKEAVYEMMKSGVDLNDPDMLKLYIDGNKCTQDALLFAAKYVHDLQKEYTYSMTGGLQYTNFEDTLNNPNMVTCCSTYVADVLHVAGFVTEEDLTINGLFNSNYTVNLDRALKNKEWQKVEDVNELKPGDVVFYDRDGDGRTNHVELYMGIDKETGKYMWYNAGNTKDIQSNGPVLRDEPDWHKKADWYAYRPEYQNGDSSGVVSIPYFEQTEGNGIVVNLSTGIQTGDNAEVLEEINLDNTEEADDKTSTLKKPQEEIEQNKDNLETDLENTEGNSENLKPEVEDTQGKPEDSKTEVEDTQGKPEDSKPEVEDTQGKPEDSKPEVEDTQVKPDTTKPNSGNVTRPTVKPSEPEYVEPVIQEKTPEAIIDAAQKAPNTTSSSEYVCSVLHESGYLSAEGKEILKNYSIDDLCVQFEKFGWEKITQSNNIQVGDIVIMKTEEGTVAKIYAGYDLWYVQGNTELQIVDPNWSENTMWYAYRPLAYPMGPTATL